jgi:predicted nucleic acid binding AN1-type Zn finger protein
MYIFCTKHVHLSFKRCTCFDNLIRTKLFLSTAKAKIAAVEKKKGLIAVGMKIVVLFWCDLNFVIK